MNGRNLSINVGGRLMDFARPRVMGILNVTSDSFFSDSRKLTEKDILETGMETAMLEKKMAETEIVKAEIVEKALFFRI